tara:strand:+ start:282 stop:461 length:180 start_codon:yes stop_codon:yes gene_type:complete
MKFEDAVKKSIKAFMNGKTPQATDEMSEGGIFHTPAYFDEMEEDLLDDDKKEESVDEDV